MKTGHAQQAERIHRIDGGTARTWCGRALDGVPAKAATHAYLAKKPGGLVSITTGDKFNCKLCHRHARRIERFADAAKSRVPDPRQPVTDRPSPLGRKVFDLARAVYASKLPAQARLVFLALLFHAKNDEGVIVAAATNRAIGAWTGLSGRSVLRELRTLDHEGWATPRGAGALTLNAPVAPRRRPAPPGVKPRGWLGCCPWRRWAHRASPARRPPRSGPRGRPSSSP